MHQVETENSRSPRPLRLAGCIIPIALTLILLTGCASKGPIKAPELIERGEYEAAMQDVKNSYSCEGKDQLLCEMMLAMIEHRFEHYQASGHHLQIAEKKAEELYTISLLEWLIQTITNPGMASYRGTEYEWVYLSYLGAINYLNLARTASDEWQQREQLAEARVEIRRVNIKLHDIETRKGTYDEAAYEKREFLHQERNSLARRKLDAKQRTMLKTYSDNVAQLIVIEHFDRVPQTSVLNMVLRVNRPMKAFVLSPVPQRGAEDSHAAMAWFRMVYSDRGLLQLIHKYNHSELMRVAFSPFNSCRHVDFDKHDHRLRNSESGSLCNK